LPKKRSAFAKTWGKVRKALGTRNLVTFVFVLVMEMEHSHDFENGIPIQCCCV